MDEKTPCNKSPDSPLKKRDRRFFGCGPILLILLVVFFFSIFSPFSTGNGSEKDAIAWSNQFATITSIEQAEKQIPKVNTHTFDNGEWVFGLCTDSHSSSKGGTITVKDSNGDIRSFFGHVCGGSFLSRVMKTDENKNLDEFYVYLTERCTFDEVTVPISPSIQSPPKP